MVAVALYDEARQSALHSCIPNSWFNNTHVMALINPLPLRPSQRFSDAFAG